MTKMVANILTAKQHCCVGKVFDSNMALANFEYVTRVASENTYSLLYIMKARNADDPEC